MEEEIIKRWGSVALILFTFIVGFTAVTHGADLEKQVAKCSAIKGDLERLECFDKLAKNRGLAGPKVVSNPAGKSGKWEVQTKVNPIDDSKTVALVLKSDNAKSQWGKPVVLIMRCQSNTTDLYIGWGTYLGSEASVLTRVGSKEARKTPWSLSTDSQATFFPRSPIGFIKELMETDKFVAQITPYNESPVTAVFDISGLSEAIVPLRETCSW